MAPPTTPTLKAPKPPKVTPPKPVMPPVDPEIYVENGDVVHWYPGADAGQAPMIGITTAKGIGQIDLNVVTAHLHNTAPQMGVMHMSDPRARTDANQGGGWRHLRATVAVRRFLIALGLLVWDGDQNYVVSDDVDLARIQRLPAVELPAAKVEPPKP